MYNVIMNKFQKRIDDFGKQRDWHKFYNPKDLLLGIVEEIGEIRNVIKWEQDPKVLKKVIAENFAEVENNIGDIYWTLAILATECNVDLDTAIEKVIKDNKKRFPVKDLKGKHSNRYLGGVDKKYE